MLYSTHHPIPQGSYMVGSLLQHLATCLLTLPLIPVRFWGGFWWGALFLLHHLLLLLLLPLTYCWQKQGGESQARCQGWKQKQENLRLIFTSQQGMGDTILASLILPGSSSSKGRSVLSRTNKREKKTQISTSQISTQMQQINKQTGWCWRGRQGWTRGRPAAWGSARGGRAAASLRLTGTPSLIGVSSSTFSPFFLQHHGPFHDHHNHPCHYLCHTSSSSSSSPFSSSCSSWSPSPSLCTSSLHKAAVHFVLSVQDPAFSSWWLLSDKSDRFLFKLKYTDHDKWRQLLRDQSTYKTELTLWQVRSALGGRRLTSRNLAAKGPTNAGAKQPNPQKQLLLPIWKDSRMINVSQIFSVFCLPWSAQCLASPLMWWTRRYMSTIFRLF